MTLETYSSCYFRNSGLCLCWETKPHPAALGTSEAQTALCVAGSQPPSFSKNMNEVLGSFAWTLRMDVGVLYVCMSIFLEDP